MSGLSDEQLLDAYFGGDAGAFQAFYKKHSGRVVAYAMSKGLPRELAVEVCQEAFLRLHRFIHKYEHGRPALPWFFSIVHHCMIDSVRTNEQIRNLINAVSKEERLTTSSVATFSKDPIHALKALTPEQQKIVKMRAIEELSFAEISEITGKSEVALRKLFERARSKLKALFREDQINAS